MIFMSTSDPSDLFTISCLFVDTDINPSSLLALALDDDMSKTAAPSVEEVVAVV
jgi:hypothetical protein